MKQKRAKAGKKIPPTPVYDKLLAETRWHMASSYISQNWILTQLRQSVLTEIKQVEL